MYYARLAADRDGGTTEELSCARVRFIRGGGIMISGYETPKTIPAGESFMQSWWCVPVTELETPSR
jgi:hypothetical protein